MPQHTYRESTPGAAQWVPDEADLEALRSAAQECRGCELDEVGSKRDDTFVTNAVKHFRFKREELLLGPSYRVTRQRGQRLELEDVTPAVSTVHPSSVLRTDDRHDAYAAFVSDLEVAVAVAG